MKKEEILKMTEKEHRAYHRKLFYVFIIIIIVLFGGAIFYHYVEGWRYLDALYFSAVTMATVGYGEITPKTDIGKIFTTFYVFVGVGMALYGLSLLASHFVEVREEFWLQQIGKIKIRQHTQTLWEKFKNLFSYEPEKLVKGYEKSVKIKK